MNINITFKNLIIVTTVVAITLVAFIFYSLAGFSARPVVFAEPPAFVDDYAAALVHSDAQPFPKEPDTGGETELVKITKDFFNEAALVRNVILNGDSPDVLLKLFTHPEKAQRVKVALAFAAVNSRLSHDEGSGFDDKRGIFWENADVVKHIPDMQNAFFEALIASAYDKTKTYIPYTLAWWMPGYDQKRDQMLAWAAEHHSDPWVRRFSVKFVSAFGKTEGLAGPLLDSRIHDPDFKVRKEAFDQRLRRFAQFFRVDDGA